MEKFTKVGIAVLISGVAMVLWTAPQMGDEVVESDAIDPNVELATIGPYDLSAGTYRVWLENYRDGPLTMDRNAYLTNGDEELWGDGPLEQRTQDWEGVECELLAHIVGVPEGEWSVALENWDTEFNATQEEVRVFLVRSPSTGTVSILFLGSAIAFLGILFVLMAGRSKKEG